MAKSNNKQDAIQLLKADHREVEELFAKFEKASRAEQKQKLAAQICMALAVHATIEEEIFYPACQDIIDEDLSSEAYVEHDGAKVLIAEINASEPTDEFYDARVTVLSEMIKHHVKEEEQRGGLFAQAKQAGLDMKDIGEKLSERKAALKAQLKAEGLPPPETRTMRGAEVKHSKPVAPPQ